MFKTVWRLLLMFNGVSSDEDERRAAAMRRRRDEELARSNASDTAGRDHAGEKPGEVESDR